MDKATQIYLIILLGSIVGYVIYTVRNGFKLWEAFGSLSFISITSIVYLYFFRKDLWFIVPIWTFFVFGCTGRSLKEGKKGFDARMISLVISAGLGLMYVGLFFRGGQKQLTNISFVLWAIFIVITIAAYLLIKPSQRKTVDGVPIPKPGQVPKTFNHKHHPGGKRGRKR